MNSRCDPAAIGPAARVVSTGDEYDPLTTTAGKYPFVLIGEASHGSAEFYAIRAELTRQLIIEKNFRIVALEADWPDMLRVHRYVTGRSKDDNAAAALGNFRRFPAWMWRNTVMLEFVEWVRHWNLQQPNERERVGIFGMDLYSMHNSIDSVLNYLEKVDPAAAKRARDRYRCFEFFGPDPQAYGYATERGQAEPCEAEVVAQLIELRRKYGELMSRDGDVAADELFYAAQNARLVANAERYYRSMFRGRDVSWNLRDEHMSQTVQALVNHFDGGQSKVVIWAHNSHLGDARATEMAARGEWNVGQIMREHHDGDVFSIGFTTHSGEVTAASDWGGLAERKRVRPALSGSYEQLFHEIALPCFWLDLREKNESIELLEPPRLERAIGVIYRPETERWSHYFEASLPGQFDALIHIDQTSALEPLERSSEWDAGELPETYPQGL